MPVYKLTYFDLRAKGEVIRFLFALGGVKYEDIRYDYNDWPNNKNSVSTPFGQLPILSIDGEVYCQSFPICRYLAEKFGYAGKTDLDRLKADMIVHCCEDMLQPLVKIRYEKDEKKKAELAAKFKDEELKPILTNFNKFVSENKHSGGYFVGDSLTWADLTFFQYVTFIKSHAGFDSAPHIAAFPKLKALLEKVEKVPQIADWIAKRPNNPF